MSLFDTTSFRVAEQGLNVMARQAEIIAQNIANADTPGYKAKYLYFEGILRDELNSRSAGSVVRKRLEIGTAVYTDEITNDQPDGNNVDSDTQQALFNKNRLMYDLLVNQLNSDLTMVRTAMRKQ
ncbi:flagellar basal body rod protein FlgB [Clostridia bacterium]|nr:flagellar basal body rod protein FlgB [Clostridia bacterium]